MTEHDAREQADKIVRKMCGVYATVREAMYEEPWARLVCDIADALLAASTPPTGHILDATGAVRKEIGTPPVTMDGVRVVPECDVVLWCPVDLSDRSAGYTRETGRVRQFVDGTYCLTTSRTNQCWEVDFCVTTPEAAEAARRVKA